MTRQTEGDNKLIELARQASKLARIGSWEIDVAGEKIYWSEMVYELLETDPNTFNPDLQSGLDFYREDFRPMANESVQKCIETGAEFDFEAVIVTQKKKERWVRAIGNAELIDGKCSRIYGSFQDIHAFKSMELQIREILESISDAFFAVDKDWNFTYFNKEAENILLKKAEDVLGKNIWKLFPAGIGTPIDEIYHRVVQSKKPESFEYNYPADGKWYEIKAYPSQGGLSAYFRNIDERKHAAEELEKAYQEKINILESIGDAFFHVNRDWVITYCNKQTERVLDRKRDTLNGKILWEEYPDAVGTNIYHQYHKAMETQENVAFEEFYPPMNMWLELAVYPTNSGLSVFFKDITQRKESDIRLRQANERFEKVTDATQDAIWDWNILEDTLYWGAGFGILFGYQIEKITPTLQSWSNHIHPDDRDQVLQSIHEAIVKPDQTNWITEYRYQKNDGNFADVVDRGIVIRDERGNPIRMVGAMADISERKSYEAELVKLNESLKKHAHELELTNEQLEQFAFIASHDLQEPLRMISSFLEQLKRKYGSQLDEKAHQYINFSVEGAKRMKQIILDLLEYSRAGKFEKSRAKINLDQLLYEYKSLRKKIIEEKSASITHPLRMVTEGYWAPYTQVIHCLLDNAIKYSREGVPPVVELGVVETDSEWVHSVRDNGIGISPEFFEKIFVIFQRLHNRERYGGSGIGLSIVKKQVESWGGKVWLESTPGEGSVFYFTLPK